MMRPGLLLPLAGTVVLIVAALLPGVLAPGDPLAISPAEAFSSPSLAHPFGTDDSGRDLLLRVMHGAGASIGIGVGATAVGLGIGLVLGFLAGLGPRGVDAAVSRVMEVLFAFPTLVMALLFVAVIGPGPTGSVLAIGLATAPGYARILRSQARQVATSDYVWMARLDGTRAVTVFRRHVLPNTLWPLIAAGTLGVAQSVVWVAALSFLGLGSPPPAPEWGAMLDAGRDYLLTAWWMTLFPGAAIVATALCLTALGRALGRGVR